MEGGKIVFVGDSRVRQMFWAATMKLDKTQAESEMELADRHSNLSFRGPGRLTVDFIWDPYLNSTGLLTELTKASLKDPTINRDNEASVIMIGGGLWFAKNLDDFSLQRFSESVENIFHTLGVDDHNNRELDTLPRALPQKDHATSLVMFAPVTRPFYASLDSAHAKTLTPARIQPLREKLLQAWHLHRFPVLWAFDLMTVTQPEAFQPDGLHVLDNVADSMVDLMLNVKCNNFLARTSRYPTDKTCCSKYPQVNWTQGIFIFIAWSSLLVTCLLSLINPSIVIFPCGRVRKPSRTSKHSEIISIAEIWLSKYLPSRKIVNAITTLLMVSYYCWWADRTPLLDKVQKHYSKKEFVLLCLATLVVGMLSIYRSVPPGQQNSIRKEGGPDIPFLPRDQTDEWKGWMQLIILIYHYTGASKVLLVYKTTRLLVASYLFLTGYGHTIFFCKKADYSLKRVAGVLIRLNMLSCILPYIMKTDYIFYYFAPLVSFWYLVVYATMAIGRSYNKTLLLLIMKIVASATLMTVLIFHWPGFFESIFFVLGKLCKIHWDSADWHFRLKLDNYIIYSGMLVGVYTAANEGQKTLYVNHSEDDVKVNAPKSSNPLMVCPLSNVFDSWFCHKKVLYLAMTLVGCFLYAYYAYPATNKVRHNESFSVVSFGPVLAYVAIRNSFPWTRRYHSGVFAWMGRYSLETFILQYHIWLAADTKGVLSTGLFQRDKESGKWADFTLLTVLFLWVCWHVGSAIQTLTAYIVDPESMRDVDFPRQDLPRTSSNEIPEKRHRDEAVNAVCNTVPEFIAGWLVESFRQVKGVVAKDLWTRLLFILLVLWLLNLVI